MRLFSCLALVLFTSVLFAQGEANYWYFGRNAGLDFSSGTAVAITDGALNTNEGCSTISDADGNLLFYTDGIRVWDKNHNTMPNGFGLMGNDSSTQSGIIVPKPNDPNIYFIFTVAQLGQSAGLRYSEVDLTLNGGNGDVTANKNILLSTPSTEKITAIQHANGLDYWVIAHKWNSADFVSYRVTSAGVETSAVVSTVGSVHNGNQAETIGYMKISPDGQKLAIAKWYNNTFVEVFDFDANSGTISNVVNLSSMFSSGFNNGVYGVEFSPNSELLYVSDTRFSSGLFEVHQFNIALGNETDIINSDQMLYQGTDVIAALQLAIDEKIYLANGNSGFLDVIENPNEIGAAAGYVNRALSLLGRDSALGLPPFIQSFFQVGINVEFTCVGDETQFSINSSQEIANIQWDFGDGNTTSEVSPTHVYTIAGTYPVTVSVNSVSGTNRFFTTNIVIHDVPIANEVADYHLCDDSTNDEVEIFDLSTKDSEVLGTQSDSVFDIRYYESMEDAQNHENELPTSYTNISNSQTIYVKIYNVDNLDCYDITSFDLVVDTMPVANTLNNLILCDDISNDGTELVDLTQFNDAILNGQTASDFNISYHISQMDAENDANPLPEDFQTVDNPQQVFIRIENVVNENCYDTGSFEIIIDEQPIAYQPDDMFLCDDLNDGEEAFNLSSQNNQVSNGQVGFNITYHLSQEDADDDQNPLTSPYTNETNPQQIFVRIENTNNSNCYDTTSFTIQVDAQPIANTVTDLMVCDDVSNDGTELVDLTQFNDAILNGQTASDFNITYHISQMDAENDTNPLPDDFQTVDNPQQVFIRIENVVNESCYDTGSFEIIIDEQPIAYQPDDMFLCDVLNDGEEAFNFSSQNNQVSNGQVGFNITYHLSQEDADDDQNPLTSPYTNESNPQQIFVRIENTNNNNCYDTTSFTIQLDAQPVANVVADVTTCDDASNDGTELVDLTQFDNVVLNGQAASDFNITYHISQVDAENDANPLPDNFQTVDNPQQVFIRIENVNNASCFETGSFQIIIDDYLEAYQPDDMYLCDAFNDGEESFDLNLQNDQISNGQTGNFAITYHVSQADADLNENPLSIPYTNITNPQQIFARIENMENFDCYNTTSFYIEALETPDPDMETTYYFCTDETVVLDAGFGYDSYLWSTGETTQSIVVGSAGNYDVTVAYDYPTMPPLSCSFTETVQVIESDEAIINDIEIEDWTAYDNTITVEVSGIGDYEFSIDGINYQSSNVFNNLPVGEYTVYVRDQNGCGVVNEEVYVLYYPKFFTPNGDGDNDNWQVYFSQTEPDITVLIFDRYGKLLKQLNALSDGWDGTFNGEYMPTSDYWFVVNRPSKGKQYRAHFTLKR